MTDEVQKRLARMSRNFAGLSEQFKITGTKMQRHDEITDQVAQHGGRAAGGTTGLGRHALADARRDERRR